RAVRARAGARAGPAGAAAAADLARRGGPAAVRALRLGARLAGAGLGRRRPRRTRPAADPGISPPLPRVPPVRPAGRHGRPAGAAAREEPAADGPGLPPDARRAGAGPLRGPVVARLPPPRLPGHAGVRLRRAGAAPVSGAPGPPGRREAARLTAA